MTKAGTAFLVCSTLLAVQLLSQGRRLFSEILGSVKGEGSIELNLIFLLGNLEVNRRKSMNYCFFTVCGFCFRASHSRKTVTGVFEYSWRLHMSEGSHFALCLETG